ncbi:putative zinc-binding metallopeptidase [Allorhodopirellula solitaria]|uniref:Zinc-ribbon domain-containing protein n=1 Tax=Allorhodopirellula solitaria TaxID=2527987 RepID=A0A5C5WNG2_9BACT|nr:putative zinc-binding metallopeptidase [Allorhodopirellula solitaria]TWT52364.1 hypothetical protein CA85_50180 [Allorhodopirellula solitaria]
MKTGTCRCGRRIFFNNHSCLACEAILGRCDECRSLTSFTSHGEHAECDVCHTSVHACENQNFHVCRSYVSDADKLCQWCQFTAVTPDTSIPQQVSQWATMESAKRRLLLELHRLSLPPYVDNLTESHPLSFLFLADTVDEQGNEKRIITGHDQGVITINLAEADSVHRERTRVELGEPQRTLIGHMRHEVGHYIDWAWAMQVDPEGYHALFGDPQAIDYSQAMDHHYQNGAPENWAENHVSAYATMHPWEDFAETANLYLDIMAIATTANDQDRAHFDLSPQADMPKLVNEILQIVVEASEYNCDLGLAPLLPEQLPPAVIEKLAYVHSLRRHDTAPA